MNSPDGLLALVIVLSAWALMAWLYLGAGLLASWLLGLMPDGSTAWARCFWLGVAATIAWLQVWHLVLPSNHLALALAAGLALAGWGVGWRRRTGSAAPPAPSQTDARPPSRVPIMLAGLVIVFLAHRATASCDNWDTGLYHAPAIQWAHRHAIVPGLGNLNWRLAFNNANFLIAAMMETGPWRQRSPHILNGVLVAALAAPAVLACGAMLRQRAAPSALQLLHLATLVGLTGVLHTHVYLAELAAPSPDVFAACLALAGGQMAFAFLAGGGDDRSDTDGSPGQAIACVAVVMAGACVKLSLLMFAAPLSAVVALVAWRRARQSGRPAHRPLLLAALVGAALMAPWMGRSVILSGYPLFPSNAIRVAVPWRIELGDGVGPGELMAWARTPPQERSPDRKLDVDVMRDWAWVPGWWRRTLGATMSFVVPGVMTMIGLALLVSAGAIRRHRPGSSRAALGVAAACAVSLIAWFLTAPDPRYHIGPTWVLAIVTLSAGVAAWPALMAPKAVRALALAAVTIFALRLPYPALYAYAHARANPMPLLYRHFFVEPGDDHGLHPPPKPPLQTGVTRSGLAIHFNPQTGQNWYAPLPNALFVDPSLRLRREGDLGSGFIIDRTTP